MEIKLDTDGYRSFEGFGGDGRCKVAVTGVATPNGIAAYVYGGVAPHIGGAAVSGEGSQESSCRFVRPTHKDHILAEAVADILSKGTGQTVYVAAGFHLDDITKEEIAAVVQNGREAAKDALLRLQSE